MNNVARVICVLFGALFIYVGALGLKGKFFARQPGMWQYGVTKQVAAYGGIAFILIGVVVIFAGLLLNP